MNNNMLSPDEIKALLGESKNKDSKFTSIEMDALSELFYASLGSATHALTNLLSKRINSLAPKLQLKKRNQLFDTTDKPFFIVLGEWTGFTSGIGFLSISQEGIYELAKLINPSFDESDETSFQMVQQIVEQLMSAITQSITAIVEQPISHSLNGIDVLKDDQNLPLENFTKEETFIEIEYSFKLENQSSVTIYQYIPVSIGKKFVEKLVVSTTEDGQGEAVEMSNESEQRKVNNTNSNNEPKIQSVQFTNFDETPQGTGQMNNLEMLLDVPLKITVELGRTKRTVKEILEISQGSIIELDKLAGEPIDILVNDKPIAVGEVVVIDENFGVRVTDILSTEERLTKLR